MNCWSCGVPSREDDNFCSKCGARMESASEVSPGELPCRSCGASLPTESQFCGNCGIPDPLAGRAPAKATAPAKREPIKPAPAPARAAAAAPPKKEAPRPAPSSRALDKKDAKPPAAAPGRPSAAPLKPPKKEPSGAKPLPARAPPGPTPTPRPPKQDRSAIAPTAGWPDITEEIAEVRFFMLQGLDDEAKAAVLALRVRHPGHPELAEFDRATGGEPEAASTLERTIPPDVDVDLGSTGQFARSDLDEASTSMADGSVPDDDGETLVDEELVDRTLVSARPSHPALHWDAPPKGETVVGPPPSAPEPGAPPPSPSRSSATAGPPRSSPSSAKTTRRNKTVEAPKPSARTGTTAPPTGRAPTGAAPPTGRAPTGAAPPTGRAPTGAAPPQGRASSGAPAASGRTSAPQPSARTGSTAPPTGRAPKRNATVPTPTVPAAAQRTTVVPDRDGPPKPAPFGGAPPPGSTLVPGTSPAGASGRAAGEPSAALEPVSAAVASGRVVEARRSGGTQVTPEGTVISSMPPSVPAFPVKVVMLGTRGEAVADRVVEPGTTLEIGRGSKEPWGDDEYLEVRHARLTPAPGGVRVEDSGGGNGVFMQITERLRVRDGDEFRIGQSLVCYERSPTSREAGPWGRLLSRAGAEGTPRLHPLGGAGILIGRDEGAIKFPGDTFVSSSHCRITCEGDDVYIEDLDSSNGTYLKVRSGESVGFGTLLLMGQTQFRIRPA
jgi:pSer/pThr/pTyr-binding forkhead associated (FHA) protein